jgi:hypothetical protein
MHDRLWHKQTRRDMPETYDAIWQDGFWKGIGLVLAIVVGAWFYAMANEYLGMP